LRLPSSVCFCCAHKSRSNADRLATQP
jgi:hypothetical protein